VRLFWALILGGCLTPVGEHDVLRADLMDGDGDGHTASTHGGDDCDDSDPDVHPGAEDAPYDGVDADCGGDDDYDADGDGYGASQYGGEDCDDTLFETSPAAAEICGDGLDNDCDGAGGGCFPEGSYDESDADVIWIGGANLLAMSDTRAGVAWIWEEEGVLKIEQIEELVEPDGSLGIGTRYTLEDDDPVSVSSAGLAAGSDLDGDGTDDLVLGLFRGSAAPEDRGGVWVVSLGGEGALDRSGALLIQNEGGEVGPSVSLLEDVDDEGLDELLLGSSDGGRAWLVVDLQAGEPGQNGLTINPGADALRSDAKVEVLRAGDLDGDGLEEGVLAQQERFVLAMGDALAVIRGQVSAGDLGPLFSVSGHSNVTVAAGGEMNGDGFHVLVVSAFSPAQGHEEAGRVGVVDLSITAIQWKWIGERRDFGTGLSAGEDFTGDGRADLLVGTPSGKRVDLYAGGEEGTFGPADSQAWFRGTSVGHHVKSARDLDGNGLGEILVGEPGRMEDGLELGGVLLFSPEGM